MVIVENGRIKLSLVCDSLVVSLAAMVKALEEQGCTDIQVVSRPATAEEIPEDKPWCKWYYEANGILPKEG